MRSEQEGGTKWWRAAIRARRLASPDIYRPQDPIETAHSRVLDTVLQHLICTDTSHYINISSILSSSIHHHQNPAAAAARVYIGGKGDSRGKQHDHPAKSAVIFIPDEACQCCSGSPEQAAVMAVRYHHRVNQIPSY